MQTKQRPQQSAPRSSRTTGQCALALEPAPEHVLEAAEALRCRSSYWRQRYRTLEDLLADPQRARMFLICARGDLIARQRRIKP